MAFLVTARKWRPMIFDDVTGQSHVTTTLRNAIKTKRISHAYIFSGPRGVGKTTTARILAKAINCLHPKDNNPDNNCELCVEITEGRSLNVFEIDGASNRGIDEIRNLRESLRYGPQKGKYKVYIIDEVHMLTKEAFNALLKSLEEPPPFVLFIFATTTVHKVLPTILSRCQRFDFHRIPINDIIERLRFIAKEENISIDDNALSIIAKRADGSLRDALGIFDQVASYCGETISTKQTIETLNIIDEEIYFKITDIIKSKDSKGCLLLINEIINRGYDIKEFLDGLNDHFRNLLVTAITGTTRLIETSDVFKQRYQESALYFSENDLLRFMKIIADIEPTIRFSQQPRLKIEIALLLMIKMDESVSLEQLLQQLQEFKKKFDLQNRVETIGNSTIFNGPDSQVRGSVKASQPSLYPDQIVPSIVHLSDSSSLHSKNSGNTASSSSIPALHQTLNEKSPIILSVDETKGKWSSLIDEARKQRIAIGTMLSETKLVDIRDNHLYVGCPDAFHLDVLKRNREFLSELAQKVYGAKVRLETVLSSDLTIQPPESGSNYPQLNGSPDGTIYRHPVVQALIREFDAEEIG